MGRGRGRRGSRGSSSALRKKENSARTLEVRMIRLACVKWSLVASAGGGVHVSYDVIAQLIDKSCQLQQLRAQSLHVARQRFITSYNTERYIAVL